MTDTTGFSVMATLKRAAHRLLRTPSSNPPNGAKSVLAEHCGITFYCKYKAVNSPLLTDQVIEVAQLAENLEFGVLEDAKTPVKEKGHRKVVRTGRHVLQILKWRVMGGFSGEEFGIQPSPVIAHYLADFDNLDGATTATAPLSREV